MLQILIQGLLLSGLYSLIAMGFMLIFSVGRVLNLAYGTYLMFGGYVYFYISQLLGMPKLVGVVMAGVMGAKQTSSLIPLCHPLPLDDCQIEIETSDDGREVTIHCRAQTHGKTGVEMEALTGASIAALTLYDMGKAVSKGIVIKETRLIEKTGGKSDYRAT
ncbi:MAG: hypothetical protein JKY94_04620 [Rhodobacteraceae bacterium]|nr:hypothetical protein [Paracoccaceae bacterium]